MDVTLLGVATSLRWGLTQSLEPRLGAPLWTRVDVEAGPFDFDDEGYGDLEFGVKWSHTLAADPDVTFA
ncbi:MAG: hypothetical protein ACRD2Z_02985, partial [Thermoanaerobaculia bacterium]